MRCPDCASQRTEVRTIRSSSEQFSVTSTIIAVCVAVFIVDSLTGGLVTEYGALSGPAVYEQHEYWRIVTSAFLHSGFIHIGFNMFLLWLLGQLLEPALGKLRFTLLYFTSLFAGSFGVLLVSPDALTVGASGAVFGLMGAAVFAFRGHSGDIMRSGLGPTILLNLVITFALPGISIGGHIGGLIGGLVAGFILIDMRERWSSRTSIALCTLFMVLLAAGAVVGL